MRPPDGEVRRGKAAFDRSTYGRQRRNRTPMIAGPVGPKQNRVLQKDILWSPRPVTGLGRNERAAATAMVPAFSVLNNIGNAGDSKYKFFQDYWFVGLSVKTMEANAINTDTGNSVAVDKQGLTWLINKGEHTIRAGDEVMIDIPDNTEDADRREKSQFREGGTPERRYTAFPTVWSVRKATDAVQGDWAAFMRGDRGAGATDFPTTPSAVTSMQQMVIAGIALAYGYHVPGNLPATPQAFIDRMRDAATGGGLPQAANFINLINQVAAGAHNADIAALLFPDPGEYVVPGARVDPGAALAVRNLNGVQRTGVRNLMTMVDASINDAGRSRVIGRAVNMAKPNEPLSLILYG